MYKLLRRATAFLLALVMVFGLVPTAFASEVDESPPEATTEPEPETENSTEPADATAPESTEDPPPDTGPASEESEPEAESTTPPDVTDPETTEPEETVPDTTLPDETVPTEQDDGWEQSVSGTYFFFSDGGKTYTALPTGSASTQEEEDLTVGSATHYDRAIIYAQGGEEELTFQYNGQTYSINRFYSHGIIAYNDDGTRTRHIAYCIDPGVATSSGNYEGSSTSWKSLDPLTQLAVIAKNITSAPSPSLSLRGAQRRGNLLPRHLREPHNHPPK